MATKRTKLPRSRPKPPLPRVEAPPLPPVPAYPVAKRLLSPDEIRQGAADVVGIAAREGVRVVLVGGVAMQVYGSDRLTADVDFAADRLLAALPEERALTFGGVATHTPGGVPVDLIVRADDYADLYADALFTAVRVEGLPACVVRPEELVAMKMAAARDKDVLDLKYLLGTGLVDLARARLLVRRHLGPYAAQEFDRIVDEVAWLRSRGRTE